MKDEQWRRVRLTVGNGGWVCYRSSDLEEPVLVRFAPAEDGRLEVADLFVPFSAAPDARHLRDVAAAVSDADTWVNNDPGSRETLISRLDVQAPDLRASAAMFSSTGSKPPRRPFGDRPEPAPPAPSDLSLQVPSTRAYPDDFYEAVAEVYAMAVTISDRPAVEIAEANDVPVKTVHRWVAEARKRGHLAPGRKGRAG